MPALNPPQLDSKGISGRGRIRALPRDTTGEVGAPDSDPARFNKISIHAGSESGAPGAVPGCALTPAAHRHAAIGLRVVSPEAARKLQQTRPGAGGHPYTAMTGSAIALRWPRHRK